MINIIIIEEGIKIGTDQIAEMEDFRMDKIEVDLGMKRITGMIIGEEILGVTWELRKIYEDRIVEKDIEEMIGMKIITEKVVGVGPKKDIQAMIEGVTGLVVIVDHGQDQEWVQTEIELGVISVENMIISWKDCPTSEEEKGIEQIQQMFNLGEGQTSSKNISYRHVLEPWQNKFFRKYDTTARTFKLIEGKNDPITFLPLSTNIGDKLDLINISIRKINI